MLSSALLLNSIILQYKNPNAQSCIDQSLKEFNKVIDYLYSIGKDAIADEVINVKELIDFSEESNISKSKKENPIE